MPVPARPSPPEPRSLARGKTVLLATMLALSLANPVAAAHADADYPPGLFENSPVVPRGYVPPETPAAPADATPPGPSAGLGPDGGAQPGIDNPLPPPPGPAAPGPYAADPPAYDADWCAGVASRTFHSLEEVRRAHRLCDRAAAAPPPGYPPGW